MNILTMAGNVLLSEWLWSITWGIYHVPIAIVVMMFLLKRNTHLAMVPTVLLSVASNLFSFALYTLFIVGGLIFGLGFEYSSSASFEQFAGNALSVCLLLAFIYIILQFLFFWLIKRWYPLPFRRVCMLAALAQLTAGCMVFLLLPLYY